MSRYLAIQPGSAGEPIAIRVKLTALLQTAGQFEGEYRWVGPSSTYPEGNNPTPTFTAGELQCTPHFADFGSLGTLHIYGPEIMPFSNYDVQLVHEECAEGLSDPSVYSSVLNVPTAVWGDVAPPFGTASDPDNQPNFIDIAGVVERFRDLPGAPSKAHAQLQPNDLDPSQSVDFNDISSDVEGFRGIGYPFPGPSSCP
jgi:hypothetical protein